MSTTEEYLRMADQSTVSRSSRLATTRQSELVKEHFQAAAPFWEEVYQHDDVYGAIHQLRRAYVFSLVDQLRLPPGSEVLDIGCGAGSVSVGLAARGLNVKAVDRAPEMLGLTIQLASRAGVNARLVTSEGDIHNIGAPDNTFDLALAIGVLPWLSSYSLPLKELARVVRPGGHVIINVDNRWALHRILDPSMNALLAPFKHTVGHVLRKAGLRNPKPANTTCSAARFRLLLRCYDFEPFDGVMLGFGPFTFFHRAIVSKRLGLRLNATLQGLCDHGVPVARSAAAQYLVLARKLQ